MSQARHEAEDRRALRACLVAIAALALLGGALAAGLWSWRAGLSVALGGSAALLNLVLLGWLFRRWLQPGARAGAWAVAALLKFGALIAILYLLVASGVAQPLPLILGFGALPLGIVLGQLRAPGTMREEG